MVICLTIKLINCALVEEKKEFKVKVKMDYMALFDWTNWNYGRVCSFSLSCITKFLFLSH